MNPQYQTTHRYQKKEGQRLEESETRKIRESLSNQEKSLGTKKKGKREEKKRMLGGGGPLPVIKGPEKLAIGPGTQSGKTGYA